MKQNKITNEKATYMSKEKEKAEAEPAAKKLAALLRRRKSEEEKT